MGFINHCNAALGKTVLSAGRNTLQLTATAGRKTLTSERGSGDRLRMALGYFMAAFLPAGAGPQGALPAPLHYISSFLLQAKTNHPGAHEGKGERKKIGKGWGGEVGQVGMDRWVSAFASWHLFVKKKNKINKGLCPLHPEKVLVSSRSHPLAAVAGSSSPRNISIPLCQGFCVPILYWGNFPGQGWAHPSSASPLWSPWEQMQMLVLLFRSLFVFET